MATRRWSLVSVAKKTLPHAPGAQMAVAMEPKGLQKHVCILDGTCVGIGPGLKIDGRGVEGLHQVGRDILHAWFCYGLMQGRGGFFGWGEDLGGFVLFIDIMRGDGGDFGKRFHGVFRPGLRLFIIGVGQGAGRQFSAFPERHFKWLPGKKIGPKIPRRKT